MIPVLYGSQTGTCAHLARMLKNKLEIDCAVFSVDSFNLKVANNFPLIVFIVSTHGDGACPFNMARMWDLISGEPIKLFSFKFAILAVGSSSFERYNWCGKILYERLIAFGAVGILRALADTKSAGGVYDGYNEFITKLQKLVNEIKFKDSAYFEEIKFKMNVEMNKYKAKLVDRKIVTSEDYDQAVYELILDIPDYGEFRPGDCIGIIPENLSVAVSGLNLNESQAEFIRKNIDLMAPPRQTFFKVIAELAQSELHRDKLNEISANYDVYFEYAIKPKRNALEVFQEFNILPNYDLLLKLEPIYVRYYSCAKINGMYHILLRDVKYKTSMSTFRKGLCCEFLKDCLKAGAELDVVISRSRLFLEDKKLLFFSTGTGITLPRSVVNLYDDKNIKIYQGFRYYGKDELCKDEFDEVDVLPAASKDDKKYIMDVYRESPTKNIEDWLVFASGNTRINKEIRKLLREIHGEDIPFQSETW